MNDDNVARMLLNGTTTLIDDSVNAVAFGVQVGHPIDGPCPISGTNCAQAASNDLIMTGGTLTTQGNFLMNIGRGRSEDPTQMARFMMSGGVVNAAGITIPEGFNPDNVLGFTSVGINAEMHVSGDSVVNTDLLRLGAADANSVMTISDNAQVNLTDDNNGFAPGALWIEAFEAPVVGTSLLDIRDNGVLTVHGEWWTDENGDGERGAATASEAQYFVDNYVANGWIVANGGVGPNNVVDVTFVPTPGAGGDGVIYITAVPEPTSFGLLALALPFLLRLRRNR
ncbi:MAG: PEP-CTERM sorting domain-containing protein [Planctomycetota bacterium]